MPEQATLINFRLKVMAVLLISACLFSNVSSQDYAPVGRRSLVESGRAFAFKDGATILRVMLPFHLEFDSQTRLCSRFNSRMALQYVEAVRLAADLVQKSSLLGNMSIGFKIMDTCSNVDHVMEHLKALNRRKPEGSNCRLSCPNRTSDIRPKPHRNKGLLQLVVGIESSAVVKATEFFFNEYTVPLISHTVFRQPSSRRSLNSTTTANQSKSHVVFKVTPDESFEAVAILDLIAFFNWTHVGVFAPQTEEAMAMYSFLHKTNTRTCFGIQATYITKDNETVHDAAEKVKNVPLINAIVLLGDLESSLPFIRAVSELNAIDRLVWIMTSAWGKQVWNIPLNDPKYQVVAKMRHVFFLQPVPAGKKSVVGDSWQSISKQLQDRLRNADKQPQDNNPWFNKSWTAAKSLCSEDGISSQGSGMLDSSGGGGLHDKLKQRAQ